MKKGKTGDGTGGRASSSRFYCAWPTRVGFGVSMGGWLAAFMWLILRSAYVGVFVVGFCLGLYLLENWQLKDAVQEMEMTVVELEKDVISMRAVLNEMSLMNAENEAEKWRQYKKDLKNSRSRSSSSL